MQIRRPLAALLTALALFGGGVTMTACGAAGQNQNDGTTDDSGNTSGDDPGSDEQDNLPDNSNQQPNDEDDGDDQQDPD
ncbi:hypothetical protein [Blastococcus mobilis]|uniref:Uncharacterized protein n=1 Tax=Blastococcus mobilis TaxID=1938746 RepID=A0A238WXT6_9ACTN|nr:hypothetical protein [Blastococcus mobilis]SNR51310.1 hypothetical protein SAMN06272737_110115 [Blastococcus mobilis]